MRAVIPTRSGVLCESAPGAERPRSNGSVVRIVPQRAQAICLSAVRTRANPKQVGQGLVGWRFTALVLWKIRQMTTVPVAPPIHHCRPHYLLVLGKVTRV